MNSSSPEIFNQKVQLDEIKVVGYEFTAPYKAFREAEVLIPRLWFRLIEHLEEIGDVVNSNRRIGVSHNRKTDFTYYVTVEVENFTKVPNNMTQLTVPANTYASFYHHGVMERDHIDRTYQFIHNWFEKNQYERNYQSYSLEIYDEHYEPSKSSNRFEILIPVK
ncbi:GyrI-like domain-containing protein [Bacillus litorisediminis]|uniref:GyrI-like domain-containing protein n=1 Tax=Bacillus litorisediminis TaxID=2922713 RepID=UPI0028BD39EA|nr:GyrI-like domain-containing protein [Bacillus litorisediminis]